MNKRLIAIAQFFFSSAIIAKVLISNIFKIKQAKRIFINSQGFGHSVIDTIAFLQHFGSECVVISLGTSMGQNPGTERNFYFEYYYDKYSIIPLYVPTFFLRKENWRFTHPITKSILKGICFVIGNKKIVIYEYNEQVNLEILPKRISKQMQITVDKSKDILSSMYNSFKLAKTQHQSPHTLNFLFEQPVRDVKALDRFLDNSVVKTVNAGFDENFFVCLTIRRGNAPYHSNADYYFSVIEFLYSKGFRVYLLGDREYLINYMQVKKFSYLDRIINHDINEYDLKLLDIFAISKCLFVLGDQGGVWSLVSAFNKPGLIINGSCVAHLQFNVESLPRKWIYESSKSEFVEAQTLFSEIYYRYKPVFLPKIGSRVIQAENETSLILSVVERYTSNSEYSTRRVMNEMISNNFPDNYQIALAKNSCYSPEYLNKLAF